MAKFKTKTISRRTVAALKAEKDTMFWDSELPGFGVRVYPSGNKVYIVQTRADGRAAQRVTIGQHGRITPEEARRGAALVIARIKAGEEAVPEPLAAKQAKGPTVGELAARYLEQHVTVHCKPKTEAFYRQAIGKHILPALGRTPALAVDHARVTELHHALRDTPVMANKVVETLSRIYNAAENKGWLPVDSNPCREVVKYRERKRERFLTPDEFERLGQALDDATKHRRISVHAVAAIRLIMLTGCRKREILHLRWEDVDLEAGELHMEETKTGPRKVALSPAAVRVLQKVPRAEDSPWVIPGRVEGRPMRNIDEAWWAVCHRAGLKDIRIHDCRHSFASRALALGQSLPMIGRLLGHSEVQTTERYAHLASDWLKESALRISESIAADILTGYSGFDTETVGEARGGVIEDDDVTVTPPFSARLRARTPQAA